MRRGGGALGIVLGVAGCGFTGAGGTAGGDAGADADDMACSEWAPARFDASTLPAPLGPLVLDATGTYEYNTDTREIFDPGRTAIAHATVDRPDAVIVVVESLRLDVASTLRVTGARPLIVASWSSIEIAGRLDVASSGAGGLGAGANAAECIAPASGENDLGGAGGGGGGGFGAQGGRGGDGDSNENAGDDGISIGGAAGGAGVPGAVRGGCPGAIGGEGAPGKRGLGGAGGGAIHLAAACRIRITGMILAGGQGGIGVDNDGGGGGGGSGGYIGLEARAVDVSGGTLVANGGAGAGGGDDANVGMPGEDGGPGVAGAVGGVGGLPGGTTGGAGGHAASAIGETVTAFNTGAGGGGGGSVGYIVVWADDWRRDAATISPDETPMPR